VKRCGKKKRKFFEGVRGFQTTTPSEQQERR